MKKLFAWTEESWKSNANEDSGLARHIYVHSMAWFRFSVSRLSVGMDCFLIYKTLL